MRLVSTVAPPSVAGPIDSQQRVQARGPFVGYVASVWCRRRVGRSAIGVAVARLLAAPEMSPSGPPTRVRRYVSAPRQRKHRRCRL